jgi:hypothetical protein
VAPTQKKEEAPLTPEQQARNRLLADKKAKALEVDPNLIDVLFAQDFVDFAELETIPSDIVKWDPESSKYLYLVKDNLPYLYLMGRIKPGYELFFDNKWIPTEKNHFQIKLPLDLKPEVFLLRLFDKDRNFESYRTVHFWKKLPTVLSLKIDEGDNKVKQIGETFSAKFSHIAFSQLYSKNTPITRVDIDSQRHAEMSFRIFSPPESSAIYEGWAFIIKNAQDKTVYETKRFGFPPQFLDWREVSYALNQAGTYKYQVNLYGQGNLYQGVPNEFQALEGVSLLKHPYRPFFSLEPRGELGYFTFSNGAGVSYSNLYMGADLSLLFWDRMLVRGTIFSSIHTLDPNDSLAITRVGTGIRLYSHGESKTWGFPYLIRLDLTPCFNIYTVSPNSTVRRFNHFSLLIEPHFAFFNTHYFTPWVEYGAMPDFSQQRLSAGLMYQFFFRPWSLKFGAGAGWDRLLTYSADPTVAFTIFRFLGSFTFYL